MIEKSCRCGKSKKSFAVDIGPFFINECCEKEGYDHTGKKKVDAEDLGLDQNKLTQDLSSDETNNLEIEDDASLDQDLSDEEQEKLMDEAEEEAEDQEEAKLEEEQLQEDAEIEKAENEPIIADSKLEVDGDGNIVQAEEPKKKKRQYNRNGQVKLKGSSES